MRLILNLVVVALLFISCKNTDTDKSDTKKTDTHKVIAKEVIQVNEYSYIRVIDDGKENWIAAPKTQVEIGNTYYYSNAMEMKNFESKELGRKFETIYFVEKLSESAEGLDSPVAKEVQSGAQFQKAAKPEIKKEDVKIEPNSNGISIAELLKNKEKYNNTVVILKGKVTKYNPSIMNTNWVHLQDGTDFNGIFDMTVTTNTEVKAGDIISIQGKVTLNKDFGSGYVYDVIIENATVIK